MYHRYSLIPDTYPCTELSCSLSQSHLYRHPHIPYLTRTQSPCVYCTYPRPRPSCRRPTAPAPVPSSSGALPRLTLRRPPSSLRATSPLSCSTSTPPSSNRSCTSPPLRGSRTPSSPTHPQYTTAPPSSSRPTTARSLSAAARARRMYLARTTATASARLSLSRRDIAEAEAGRSRGITVLLADTSTRAPCACTYPARTTTTSSRPKRRPSRTTTPSLRSSPTCPPHQNPRNQTAS